MNDKLKVLFKGLGLQESILAEIEKEDFDVKAAITSFNNSQKEHYTEIVKNEIKHEVEREAVSSAEGKLFHTLNNDLKKIFGVPLEAIKDLPLPEKLKFTKKQLDEAYSKNPNGEDITKLQAEKVEWQNKYTDLETSLTSKIEEVRKEESKKTVSKLGEIELQKKFNSVPAEKILGKKHTDGIFLAVKSLLNSKYDFSFDEKENVVPFEKGTQKRVVGKADGGKEYFVGIDDLVVSSLKELSFLNESNGGEGSGQSGQGGNSNGQQKQKSARLLEMEAKIKEAV